MTSNVFNESKELIKSLFPGFIIDSVYEYTDIFVFNLIPTSYEKVNQNTEITSHKYSVNKRTKEVRYFYPFNMSFEEYSKGKKIL